MRQNLINQFEAGGSKLREAINGLTSEQMQMRIGPGDWSIHELVIHLMDSDSIAIDRMKRVITQDDPMLLYAYESAYVQKLFSHDQSIDDAIQLFEIGRRQFSRVLRLLPDDSFERVGTHDKTGKISLQQLVEAYVNHLDHHLKFLVAKRDKLFEE